MEIDHNAPLHAEKDILIAAPLEKVWSEITQIDQWSMWQPDVTSAKLDGTLATGTKFHWKAKGLNITSTIQLLEPMQRIGWTGKSLGMQAKHIWVFENRQDGTHVKTEESLSGWFPRILKLFDSKFLEKSLQNSLQVLKAHVEGLP
ncbi:MAG: SRPBCC family protein [Caldilineales bacterium]|nr:SRPBCC family protein [Caldilineales bacterium]